MSSAYFSLILREWGTAPEKHAALLDGIEVPTETPSQPAEITLGQQLRQVRNACRLLEPDWALALGSRLHPAAHGALGVGAASAPTMRDALFVMTRFSQLRAPHFRLRAVAAGEEVRLVPEDRVALLNAEHSALLDIVMLSTQGMIEAVLGRPMEEGRFEVPHAPPPHAELYERLFHARFTSGVARRPSSSPPRGCRSSVRSPIPRCTGLRCTACMRACSGCRRVSCSWRASSSCSQGAARGSGWGRRPACSGSPRAR